MNTVSFFKIFVGLTLIVMPLNSYAQMRTNGNTSNTALGQHVFLDASAYSPITDYPANVGKGIGFPRTDLTQWTFKTTILDGISFPTAYDGLIVYNIGTGTTLAGQGIQVEVKPGFYYFQNPGATDSITNGQWVLIGEDAATAYGWAVEGNANIDAASQFLGTTDANDLVVKTNNAERLRVLSTGNVGIGTATPAQTLTVEGTAQVTGALHDSSGDAGTSGQILSSTGTATNWINATPVANDAQIGSTLYWDGSAWVETTRLRHEVSSDTSVPAPAMTPFTAYSLRRVVDAYTGNAIRVRRSSDDTEQDIGFTSDGDLDTSALVSFVGSGDGFVTTWYDQGAGGNDVSQGNAAAQPRIVIAGTLETVDSGKPAINFAANDNLFANPTNALSTSEALTSLNIAEYNSGDWQVIHRQWGGANNNNRIHFSFKTGATNGATLYANATNRGSGGAVPQDQTAALGYVMGTSGSFISVNGTQTAVTDAPSSGLISTSGTRFEIGYRTSSFFVGKQSELLFYTSALSSADYTTIEDNQETYWIAGVTQPSIVSNKIIADNPLEVNASLTLNSTLIDSSGDAGTLGQILSSTGTATNWVDLSTSSLTDADGDTQIQLEESADEDVIRFDTAGSERLIINPQGDMLFTNQGDFSTPGTSNSAVLGIEGTTHSRLRLTAGTQETFSDIEGASIDLHGNTATANTGVLDLVAGQAASGTSAAIRFWTNTTGVTAGQQISALITGDGTMSVGNSSPNANAILDLSNTASKVLLLPTVVPGTVSGATDGMITYDSNADNAYLRANGAWKPLTFNTVTNEMIFNGEDDSSGTYDNYYYVSLIESGNWKVIRYHKTDPNDEATADVSNNAGVTVQPTTLATCIALTF